MPTLLVTHPDGTQTEHPFEGELRIGRQEGNDLVLADGGVSRRHALLRAQGAQVVLEDAGSANGTYVEGARLEGPCVLEPGQEVQLGDYLLQLVAPARDDRSRTDEVPALGAVPDAAPGSAAAPDRAGEAGASAGAALAPPRTPSGRTSRTDELLAPGAAARVPQALARTGQGPRLVGLTGPWAGQRVALAGTLSVGRGAGAGLLLEDESVSRRHAELRCTGAGVQVRDLGSANGTAVNGAPVPAGAPEGVLLQRGDAVQFGVALFRFEDGAEDEAAPLRRARGGAVPTRRGQRGARPSPAQLWAQLDPRRKRLAVAAGGVLALLLTAGVVKALSGPEPEAAAVAGGEEGAGGESGEQIQQLLSQCRSYASTELDAEPDWRRAEEACGKALDLDPLQSEAHALLQRIRLEREAGDNFTRGERALARLNAEEALDLFGKIPKESDYFRRARPRVREASAQVVKRALDDCKRYLRDSQWAAAVPRCERYLGVACQKMDREELEPPVGFKVVLTSGRLRTNEWRPKDPLFLRFLTARQRVDPRAAPWTCPPADILAEEPEAEDPKQAVTAAFQKRYADKLLQAAMLDYWSGRSTEALATLQKLRSDYNRAQYHADADAAMRDLSTVDQLFKSGQSALQAEDPERAAEPFQEVLEVDGRVMAELATTRPSFYRRAIQQDMASHAYVAGKHWADRQDTRRGCRVWKLGFGFYAGNTDLNKAVGFCSTRGLALLNEAQGCADLPAVLDFAVKGDGLQEKVAAKRAEWACAD
ncbi:FHA domain-containing protein [Aggregicoccus sp. 17bor-14]|uniref:FHA domain-containing protein n=1 Tax=Myxococcaceae TaxID=31 RepID=UPI00129C8BEE|nr:MULTISPECIES: FHA domain-containing protein [Myxococcaceae]MBF5041157.1 FHA domain-containing protein [Simulacricoccus sp. 17bor-14]MRI86944.1 FHA domain-containing protein [Aggregicoccus sp. 17bor-14]